MLMRRWERTRQGDGQLVLIVGEPGLGKSRLIEEFHARLREIPHTWVEWSCSQGSDASGRLPALHPFDCRTGAHLEPIGRLTPRRTRLNCVHNSLA
jgi:hypothetical protein